MSKISYIGSIDSKIQNNEMLKFARQTMNEEQFRKLYNSYRQLFWFQLSLRVITPGQLLLVLLNL